MGRRFATQHGFERTLRSALVLAFLGCIFSGAPGVNKGAKAQAACDVDSLGTYTINYHFGHRLTQAEADVFLREIEDCSSNLPAREIGVTVTDGVPVQLADFFEVVKISFGDSVPGSLCTGVIISPNHVLTAAHCSCGFSYRMFMQRPPVPLGPIRFFELKVEGAPVPFPGYSCRLPPERQPGLDLALIRFSGLDFGPDKARVFRFFGDFTGKNNRPRFSEPFLFPAIRPSIPVLRDPQVRNLLVAGYGLTESGARADSLRAAYIQFKSRFCQSGFIGVSPCKNFAEFSLSRGTRSQSRLSADSCGGDSGGPVFRMDGPSLHSPVLESKIPEKTLVGIVSRAITGVQHPYPGFCGGGGIYTSVGRPAVFEWLKANGVEFNYLTSIAEPTGNADD